MRRAAPAFNRAAKQEWEFNCRSGVEAALQAMGLVYVPVTSRAGNEQAERTLVHGLNKNLLGFVGGRIPDAQDETTPQGIIAEGDRLAAILAP